MNKPICLAMLIYIIMFKANSKFCSSSRQSECPDDFTCCRTPRGWRCFPVYEGICCSNGEFACKSDEICDIRSNACIKT